MRSEPVNRGVRAWLWAARAVRARAAPRIGLAIGRDRVVAVECVRRVGGIRPGRVWVRTLDAPPGAGADGWPELADALKELCTAEGIERGAVHIALLPPLARAKVIRVPAVRPAELRAVVAGNVQRFFLGGPSPALADARRLPGGGSPARAVAAVAAEEVIEAVFAAAEAAGLDIGGATAASLALAEAARDAIPGILGGMAALHVATPYWSERILLEGGTPCEIHPAAPGAVADAAAGSDTAGPEDPAGGGTVAAEAAVRGAAGSRDGGRVVILGGAGAERDGGALAREPAALAAFGAVQLAGVAPQLVPEKLRVRWRRQERRRTAGLLSTAALLLAVAAGVHYWGLARELDAVRSHRRAIAQHVAEAMAAREAVGAVRERLEAIARIEAGRHAWPERFAALTSALPDSAHLSTFAADGPTLRLDGLAESASAVVTALDSVDGFRQVALAAPVVRDEDARRERFTIALELAGAAVPAPAGGDPADADTTGTASAALPVGPAAARREGT